MSRLQHPKSPFPGLEDAMYRAMRSLGQLTSRQHHEPREHATIVAGAKSDARVRRTSVGTVRSKTLHASTRWREEIASKSLFPPLGPRKCVTDVSRATRHNDRLLDLLRGLYSHVDEIGQKMIEEHLDSVGGANVRLTIANTQEYADESPASLLNTTPETLGKHSRESSPSEGEEELGSNHSLDHTHPLDEDLLRSQESRATGYVGTNSSIQWLRSLKAQMESTGGETKNDNLPHRLPSNNIPVAGRQNLRSRSQKTERASLSRKLRASDFTFYLDHDNLELDTIVDPNELPPPETAQILFDCYIHTIHQSFPIIPDIFEEQFRRYNDAAKQGRYYPVPEEWQALLNLILAIGAQYSHLIQANWRGESNNHLVFMTRAVRILRLDKIATSLPAPSLTFIQVRCCKVTILYVTEHPLGYRLALVILSYHRTSQQVIRLSYNYNPL
jgi:hypothetical protein